MSSARGASSRSASAASARYRVLCGLAPSIAALVAFRALQGVAGALLVPSSLALIVAVFPEPERGRAVGTWTAFTTVAIVIAPLLGGGLLAVGSWRLIFFVNVPLVVLCIALIRAAVAPTDVERLPRRRDRHSGRAGLRARFGRRRLRIDRTTAPRLVKRRRDCPPGGRGRVARCVRSTRASRSRPDAPVGIVCSPELQRGERRDARRLRGPQRAGLLPHPVPPAGRRIRADREWAGTAAGHLPDVLRFAQRLARCRRSTEHVSS